MNCSGRSRNSRGRALDVHVGDPEFDVSAGCRLVRHRVPYALGPFGRILVKPLVGARLTLTQYDVLLAPLNFLPPLWRGHSVVVQHNVLALGGGVCKHSSRVRAIYRPLALARTLRRATETIAISAYLRDLLLANFPELDPARVRVAPHGVSAELVALASTRASRTGSATVLVVSALWPYKRVDQTPRVLAVATDGTDATLIIAGPAPDSQRIPLEALASELGIRERVRVVGNVPRRQLGALYGKADVLLYLSDSWYSRR